MPEDYKPIEIRPLADQPRLRLTDLDGSDGNRDDVSLIEVAGDRSLDLRAPLLALDESGDSQSLPPAMPAAALIYVATLVGGIVASSPRTNRAYLLSSRGELAVDSVDDSPNVWRRAEKDWASMAELGREPATRRRDVVLLSGQRSGYWHWWIDILPRLWLLDAVGGTSTQPLAVPPLRSQFQRESLDLLGFSSRLEWLAPGLSRFDSVTFTRGITAGGSKFPSPALADYAGWLGARLRAEEREEPSPGTRRLFVSRSGASSRRVANEAEIAPLLADREFEIVEPGRMSVRDQVALFSEARLVVGPHGAGLTNLLFAKPGTGVVEIFAASAAQDVSNYRVLASHLGLPYSRLLATPVETRRAKTPHDLDMRVDPELLAHVLAAFE